MTSWKTGVVMAKARVGWAGGDGEIVSVRSNLWRAKRGAGAAGLSSAGWVGPGRSGAGRHHSALVACSFTYRCIREKKRS